MARVLTTFLILAGLTGTGKSTLLAHAVSSGDFDFFGAEFNRYFRKTRLPKTFPEDDVSLQDRLSQHTWLHEGDVLRLAGKDFPLESTVVHFDLFWALFRELSQSHAQSMATFEESSRVLLRDEESVFLQFTRILNRQPVRDSKIAVRILKPDYQAALRRFHNREAKLDRLRTVPGLLMCSRLVYNNTKQGEAVYNLIYSAWKNALLQRTGRTGIPAKF